MAHDSFTGFEVQPTARLLWTPTPRLATWAAISRAVRTPSLYERDLTAIVSSLQVQPALFGFVQSLGDPSFRSEAVIAYEAGQRVEISKRVSLDASLYYNVYQHLESDAIGNSAFVFPTATTLGYLAIPTVPGNDRHGETYGGELQRHLDRAVRNGGGRSAATTPSSFTHGLTETTRTWTPWPSEQSTPQQPISWSDRNLDLTRRCNWTPPFISTACCWWSQALQGLSVAIPMHYRGEPPPRLALSDRIDISACVQDAFRPEHKEFLLEPLLPQGAAGSAQHLRGGAVAVLNPIRIAAMALLVLGFTARASE